MPAHRAVLESENSSKADNARKNTAFPPVCKSVQSPRKDVYKRQGVQDVFGCSGPAWDLLKKFGLDAATICKTAHELSLIHI